METKTLTDITQETMHKIEYVSIKQKSESTPHVLNVSSSLMGICFLVLTSLRVIGKAEETIIDEVTGFAIAFFMCSCVFSFLSIRVLSRKRKWLENTADILLLAGLSSLFITAMLFSFNVIK